MIGATAAIINRNGQDVTYSRVTGNTYDTSTGVNAPTYQTYSLKASIRGYSAKEITGLVRAGDRQAIIAAPDFMPAKDDRITIDVLSWAVQSVEQRNVGNAPAMYVLQIRGAGK
jgi:hypothetical protein